MNRIDLEGRRAVVTGAARGIGHAIAARLLDSGAAVALWDRDESAVRAAADALAARGTTHAQVLDLTDAAAVAAAGDQTAAHLGGIEILVNNAGIAGPNHPTWEYPVDEWRRVVEIDLVGVFLCCRALVPRMIEGGYGRVVNVASVAGKEGNPNASAYSAAKAGVIALTKSLGKELTDHGVVVNCVTPAAVETDIFKQMSQAHIDYMLSKIPMGRFGQPAEVAAMVAWLGSEDCSFTTGGVFDVTGGRSTY